MLHLFQSPKDLIEDVLSAAAARDFIRVLRLLEDVPDGDLRGKIDQQDKGGGTALCYALQHKAGLEVIRSLLRVGANPDVRARCNEYWGAVTGVQYAAFHSMKALEMVLDAGGDINTPLGLGYDGCSTLLMRVTPSDYRGGEEKRQAMRFLLDRGADVDAADKDGDTLFHLCNPNKIDLPLWTELVKKSKNINLRNKQGETCLMKYLTIGSDITVSGREKLDVLLAAGADPNLRDMAGETILTRLVHGTTKYTSPENIARNVQYLIQVGADPWAVHGKDLTLLNVLDLHDKLSADTKAAIARAILPAMFSLKLWEGRSDEEVQNAWAKVPPAWQKEPAAQDAMTDLLRDLRGSAKPYTGPLVQVPVRTRAAGPTTSSH